MCGYCCIGLTCGCRRLNMTFVCRHDLCVFFLYPIVGFGFSSTCYDMMLFVVLLRRFICVGAIQTGKVNSISQRYQIIVITALKN